MPLLDANQRINSALAERTRNIASHHAAAAREANAVVTELLSL